MTLGIVVSVRNCLAYTKEFLESIVAHTERPYLLILVDNGCTDDTVTWVEAYCLQQQVGLRVVTSLDENLSRAWNHGIREALACGCQYVAVVNNDTVVSSGWWQVGRQYFQTATDAWCVYPLEIKPARRHLLNAAIGEKRHLPKPEVTPDRILGCFMIFRASAMGELGLFDEQFQVWFGDTDMARRLTQLGHAAVFLPAIGIFHYGRKTCDSIGPQLNRLIQEDKRRWCQKWKGYTVSPRE